MWLLRTDCAELHYFARSFDAAGGYVILSHTWEGNEQTLQQVRAINERCRAAGTNARDDPSLSPKVRHCCLLAEKHGFLWLWIDSCCIDKTSSSELSEAINSMYKWYKEAEVCYAYLADVPDGDDLDATDSAFSNSRWHTRGWTLQELIAPEFLIFLSAGWHELGNRATLAKLLEETTGVPSEVLTGRARPAEYSVCVRMFWAAGRKTTRVEDEAYCLMGLFGVSMPTNYGEGKKAFIRLQYEIMQHNSDMSLFAFGGRVYQNDRFTFHPQETSSHSWMYLMAHSPREFDCEFHYIPNLGMNTKTPYPPPPESTLPVIDPFDHVELPRLTVTNYGVELRAPIYEAEGITIAVILCQGGEHHWGLFLTRDSKGKDPTRPRYFAYCGSSKPDTNSVRYAVRMADLGQDLYNLTFNGKPVKASWRTIYVVPTASDLDTGSAIIPNLILNCHPAIRFRVPRWLIARLAALKFEAEQLRNTETLQVLHLFRGKTARIFISLGSCTEHHDRDPGKPPAVWVHVDVVMSRVVVDTFTHDCSEDHVDSESWATRSKVFGDADRKVRLSFTPSTAWMEANVFVIHLELFGHVFERMLRDAAISFPSLGDLAKDRSFPTPSSSPVTSFQRRILAGDNESVPLAPPLSDAPESTRIMHEGKDSLRRQRI